MGDTRFEKKVTSYCIAIAVKGKRELEFDMTAFSWSPLSPESWMDFNTLFGPKGACGGCWCMLWRLPRKTYESDKGNGNRDAMRALVDSGAQPGIIGYLDGQPAAWCSVGPRADFSGLEWSFYGRKTTRRTPSLRWAYRALRSGRWPPSSHQDTRFR